MEMILNYQSNVKKKEKATDLHCLFQNYCINLLCNLKVICPIIIQYKSFCAFSLQLGSCFTPFSL